jgi:hypothetical protein
VDVNIAEGTHASEAAVNKQLADKVIGVIPEEDNAI